MKLEFSWMPSAAGTQASCSIVGLDANTISPIACLLMDDGGLEARTSLAWLQEGIARIDALQSVGPSGPVNWDRESWGAEITPHNTKVYSLYDDSCFDYIATTSFRTALVEWLKFVGAGPTSNVILVDLI